MTLAALPGRAQEGSGGRYAFADTTLLRDTLNLRFPRLFPLADSLEMPPDTLRALSVRYLLSLERLVYLSDSLGLPVDSVGPVMARERFNPLAARTGRHTDFSYNSAYTVGQTQSGWRNTADYGFGAGPVFIQNSTSVLMDRYRAGSGTSLRQTRSSATELGWRFSSDFSLGGRVNLERFDSRVSSSRLSQTKNEYQLSLRSKQNPMPGLSSTLNFFGGMLDDHNAGVEKRGLSGNLSTGIRHAAGSWLAQEVNGSLDGNFSRSRRPGHDTQNTRDLTQNVRGTLSLFQSAQVGLRSNFAYRHGQVETLGDTGEFQRTLTDQSSVDGTLRLRQDNDRYVDLMQKLSVSKLASSSGAESRNTRQDDGFSANARYLLWGWAFDGRFGNGFGNSRFPTRTDSGGYSEFLHTRSLDGTLSRRLTSRINAQLSAGIGLTSKRYSVIGKHASLPVSKDEWRQSWRLKGSYAPSTRFNTSLSLDVSKRRDINIPSASTGTNNNRRSYRTEWNWTYRLLPGLTAVQVNSMSAEYTEYQFFPTNNRLALEFGSVTTLNAVVTPRLSISMTNTTRRTPSGNYPPYPDDLSYFERADESETSSLRANIAYSPTRAISLTFRPGYFAVDRAGTANGVLVPRESARTLDFSGGANINWPIGSKGSLRGDIARTYRAERSTTYTSGVPRLSPRGEVDYWNGSLQLSWQL